jgi:hypothetical protein
MAKDPESRMKMAVQCPPICEHVSDRGNVDYGTSQMVTNNEVAIFWEFRCKVCKKNTRIRQDRFVVMILAAPRKDNPNLSGASRALVSQNGPGKPYSLSGSDKLFLKSLRVTPEEN